MQQNLFMSLVEYYLLLQSEKSCTEPFEAPRRAVWSLINRVGLYKCENEKKKPDMSLADLCGLLLISAWGYISPLQASPTKLSKCEFYCE